jgi:hypothetical protein
VRSGDEFEAADLPWFLSLHWAWLVAAEVAEGFLRLHFQWTHWPTLDVVFLWSFLQAGWLSRVDQRSNAIYWYVGDLALGYVSRFGVVENRFPALDGILTLAVAVIAFVSLFHLRRDMERYFKDTDDIDLKLSPGMIFFFNTLYFQSQFGEVARIRRVNTLNIVPVAGQTK